MTSIDTLAAELDTTDPGATANAMLGYLGHLPAARATELREGDDLTADEEADLRDAFA